MTFRSPATGRNRCLNRRRDHYSSRMLGGQPRPPRENYLAAAMRIFREMIRSHKRLIKLAPEYFDYAQIQRRDLAEEARRAWEAEYLPALDRIFGPAQSNPDRTQNGNETVKQ